MSEKMREEKEREAFEKWFEDDYGIAFDFDIPQHHANLKGWLGRQSEIDAHVAAEELALAKLRKAEKEIEDLTAKVAALEAENKATIQKAPAGWRFYSADFSSQASGGSHTGAVLLIRDPEEKARWHQQSEDSKERMDGPPLYVSGHGKTFEDALADAGSKALAALPIKALAQIGERNDNN